MTSHHSRFGDFLQAIDWPLMLILTMLSGVGLVNLYSAAQAVSAGAPFHIAQGLALILGLIVIGTMSAFKLKTFERASYFAYGGVVLLLILVLVFGVTINNSRRWLNLGLFVMQPSELLKIGVIVLTARYFQDRDSHEPLRLRDLWRLGLAVAAGVFLVLKQPDLGTSLTILAIFMTMVLFERLRLSSLLILGLSIVMCLPFVWSFGMKGYQRNRVISFLNLEEDQHGQAWQVRQSIIAFGSGKVWGKGHLQGTQIAKGFVPEHENDFAAANWAEEHGLIGMLFLLSIYMALIIWSLRIASNAESRYGQHIAVGMAAFIFWHVFVNLNMVTGMLPVVGLPLPLMSAGRSNLLTIMIGMGLLMNVSMTSRRKKPR